MTVIVPLIIFILMALFVKYAASVSKKYFRHKKMQWIFVIYAIVLISAVPVFYLLPEDSFGHVSLKNFQYEGSNVNGYIEREHIDIVDMAIMGTIDENQKEVHINGQWEFPITVNELAIEQVGQYNTGSIPIVVIHDASVEKVKVTSYMTASKIGSVDITDQVPAHNIEFLGSKLYIKEPERLTINLATFRKDFTVLQFSEERSYRLGGLSHSYGQQVIVIKVPDTVDVKADKQNIFTIY